MVAQAGQYYIRIFSPVPSVRWQRDGQAYGERARHTPLFHTRAQAQAYINNLFIEEEYPYWVVIDQDNHRICVGTHTFCSNYRHMLSIGERRH